MLNKMHDFAVKAIGENLYNSAVDELAEEGLYKNYHHGEMLCCIVIDLSKLIIWINQGYIVIEPNSKIIKYPWKYIKLY